MSPFVVKPGDIPVRESPGGLQKMVADQNQNTMRGAMMTLRPNPLK